MLSIYDYGVIGFYFVFIIAMGVIFSRFIKSSGDYFRGGGQMLWWMTGASAFMFTFSAWTFTGAAGKAYTDGTIILIVFFGNVVGFFINYLFFAPRYRQMRTITPIEGVRDRFGKVNEQFFTWIQVPIGVIYAGIWLNGLAIFLAAVFGWNLSWTIIIVGVVVTFMSVSGGAWAVVASDFIQCLIIMVVSVATVILSLASPEIGGLSGFVEKVPAHHFNWTLKESGGIIAVYFIAMMIQKFFATNSMQDANRYLTAKDSSHAKKAALLGACLFVVGPIIWFIPPMCAAIVSPDLTQVFPSLGVKATEAAYVGMSMRVMPAGMMGLLVCGIFAATMSSMDSGLNRNAGIFVKNFFQPIISPNISEKNLVIVSKIVSSMFGVIIIFSGLFLSKLNGLSLFDIMLQFGALVAMPCAIPLVYGVILKRIPNWGAWSSVLIGLIISFLVNSYIDWQMVYAKWGWTLTNQESKDFIFFVSVVGIFSISTLWIILSGLIDPRETPATIAFFKRVSTPVTAEETGGEQDYPQCRVMGALCLIYGAFICLLALIPNPLLGVFSFLLCGGIMLLIGYLLRKAGRKCSVKKEKTPDLANKLTACE
jgi:solute:Na+ symporter, SSS family